VEIWKSAILWPPIEKQSLDPINTIYRPVSNLDFPSNVLEKGEICIETFLFSDYTSVYSANYSCETALISVSDDILWAMEDKKVTAFAAIDLSEAFDTVEHEK